jgi:hypothetical protein
MRSMQIAVLAVFLASLIDAVAAASGPLDGLSFLVGSWHSDDGQVADTGGTSKGTSVFTSEIGGEAIVRRDRTELFDKSGKATGAFDQLMTIYADGGAVHADYLDGDHVIHYTSADVVPGKSVVFSSSSGPSPIFRLTYRLESPDALKVTFGMIPPGQSEFHQIAAGTLHRR